MEKITKNDKRTPESEKSPLEVRDTQNKLNTAKPVRKIPMGLPFSPEQFKEFYELSLCGPSDRISKP